MPTFAELADEAVATGVQLNATVARALLGLDDPRWQAGGAPEWRLEHPSGVEILITQRGWRIDFPAYAGSTEYASIRLDPRSHYGTVTRVATALVAEVERAR